MTRAGEMDQEGAVREEGKMAEMHDILVQRCQKVPFFIFLLII